MPSLHTYQLLDKELPAILMVVFVFLAFLVVLFTVIILRRCRKASSCGGTSSGGAGASDKKVPLLLIEIIKLYIPHIKVKKRGIEVLHQKINRGCLDVLIILLIPIMVGIMFITFWNVYLVEESVRGDCEPNFDCFPKVGSDFLQQEPVHNCSAFEFNGNVTYACYRLVFSYVDGLGAAGGILIFTAVLSKLYLSSLVTVYNCMKDSDRYRRFIVYGILGVIAAVIFILFVTISIGVPMLRKTIFQTVTDHIQFAMYATSILVIIVSGVIVLVGIEKEKQ